MPNVERGKFPQLMFLKRHWCLIALWVGSLLHITLAQGTVSIQGQIFLPTGQPLQEVTRFMLASEDARISFQYHYTDSQGRFILRGLGALKPYTITVESDGRRYGTTTVNFFAQHRGYVPITLRPIENKPEPPPEAVSARRLAHPPAKKALKLYQEAMQQIQEGNAKSAEEKLRRAIEVDPEFVDAYNELAVLQMGKKEYAAAVTLLRQALEKEPEALHPLLNLGISLNYLAQHQEAIKPLRHVLQQSPDFIVAHVHLGIALLETDQATEAESHLVRGKVARGLEQALAYLYLGKLYAQVGNVPEAVAAWKSYLQIDPNSPNAERIRALLAQLGHPVDKR